MTVAVRHLDVVDDLKVIHPQHPDTTAILSIVDDLHMLPYAMGGFGVAICKTDIFSTCVQSFASSILVTCPMASSSRMKHH